MAKYLVDGDTLEFVEGVTKEALVMQGQMVQICPIAQIDNRNSYSYADYGLSHDVDALLDTPINISDFSAINVEVIVHGLTSDFYTPNLAQIAFLDENGDRQGSFNVIKRIGNIPSGEEVEQIILTTQIFTNISVADGSAMLYGTEYFLAEKLDVNGLIAANDTILPDIITGVSCRFFMGDSGESTTGTTTNLGVFVRITGVK